MLIACKDKEDPEIDENPNNEIRLEDFIGTYHVESTHISGIHTFYDSIGNQIYQGFDTSLISDQLLVIEAGITDDTLSVNGLISSFSHLTTNVKAVLFENTIEVVHDYSDLTSNNFIKGNLRLEGDSIILTYLWDRSDTWSTGALPVRGEVSASGIRDD